MIWVGTNFARTVGARQPFPRARLYDMPAKIEIDRDHTLAQAWRQRGYLFLEKAVPADLFAVLRDDIMSSFERIHSQDELLAMGGALSGHLNCFPGARVKALVDYLDETGVNFLVDKIGGETHMLVSAGCNINIPGSHDQNFHIDGDWERPFIVVNLSLVDTDNINGATEIVAGTHKSRMSYSEFFVSGLYAKRCSLPSRAGDIIIRTSRLWHRGTRNTSKAMRPMIGLVYAPTSHGMAPVDFSQFDGQVALLPNRFGSGFRGRAAEWIAVNAVPVAFAARFLQSLLKD